jgi:uncharacterized protein YvpB
MINYSKDIPYHSQRNNMVIPYAACNTTSIVMALKQAGHDCNFGEGQPEDILTTLLLTQKYWSMMDRENSKFRNQGYRPNEIHSCLCAATNDLVGKSVDVFNTNVSVLRIKNHLTAGGGVVLSGKFHLSNGETLNHIISLAGYGDDGFLIDDPYGDFRTDYKDHHGNDIFITNDEFMTIFKGGETYKWAHLVSKK